MVPSVYQLFILVQEVMLKAKPLHISPVCTEAPVPAGQSKPVRLDQVYTKNPLLFI